MIDTHITVTLPQVAGDAPEAVVKILEARLDALGTGLGGIEDTVERVHRLEDSLREVRKNLTEMKREYLQIEGFLTEIRGAGDDTKRLQDAINAAMNRAAGSGCCKD